MKLVDSATTIDRSVHGTPVPSETAVEHDPGAFDASLHYFAADLQDLASQAPDHKRDPLLAIVGLVRSLADR